MHMHKKVLVATALFASATIAQAAPTQTSVPAIVNKSSISTAAAIQVAQKAVAQCKQDGFSVTATVVDASGTPLAQIRDDKAGPHTLSSSYRKAFTAVSLKKPTADYADIIAKNPKIDALRDMDERLLFLGGGLPIIINNNIVGGIGVGGAPGAHLDVECATAGVNLLSK